MKNFFLSCPRCGRAPSKYGNRLISLRYLPDCCGTVYCTECKYENTHDKGCPYCGSQGYNATLITLGRIKLDSDGSVYYDTSYPKNM